MISKVTITHEKGEEKTVGTLEEGDWFMVDDRLMYYEHECHGSISCRVIKHRMSVPLPNGTLVKQVDVEIKVKRLSEAAHKQE